MCTFPAHWGRLPIFFLFFYFFLKHGRDQLSPYKTRDAGVVVTFRIFGYVPCTHMLDQHAMALNHVNAGVFCASCLSGHARGILMSQRYFPFAQTAQPH